jgi:hypothetical protein
MRSIWPLASLLVGFALLAVAHAATNVPPVATAPPASSESSAAQLSEPQAAIVARIDALLTEAWQDADVEPAAVADDGEFIRRAYLDITGVIPRVSEARAFLADDNPDKRAVLVERLLASPRYATHMATTWRNRILPQGADAERPREALGLQKWLRTRFADNVRYDRIVGGLLMATGENELGPALYFQANDLAPEKLAGSAAELFMGVDLHCAQCHDHPFAEWSQKDFWGLAAFFARTKSADDGRMNPMNMSYNLVDVDKGDVTLPESSEVVGPKFPGGDAAAEDEWQSRRSQLVVWLTSRDNEFFARSTVNAAWQHMFGHALVESIRPWQGEKPSVGRQILDELAVQFADSNFDLRALWRTLASTRAYQLSSRHANPGSAKPELFARMLAKPLTPEQLYDSFRLLAPVAAEGRPAGMPVSLDEDPLRIEFVRRMRTPPGDPTEYRAGTLQALMLMNGAFTHTASAHDKSSLLGALAAPYMDDEQRVDALFLATLSRAPEAEERSACLEEFAACETPADRRRAESDLLWALLNSTEFAFNR